MQSSGCHANRLFRIIGVRILDCAIHLGTMGIAAAFKFPCFCVAAIAAPARRRPVKVDLMTFMVGIAETGVTDDAGAVRLACAAVPRNVAALEHVSAGSWAEGRRGDIGRIGSRFFALQKLTQHVGCRDVDVLHGHRRSRPNFFLGGWNSGFHCAAGIRFRGCRRRGRIGAVQIARLRVVQVLQHHGIRPRFGRARRNAREAAECCPRKHAEGRKVRGNVWISACKQNCVLVQAIVGDFGLVDQVVHARDAVLRRGRGR
mmetsp:Transcript_26458/g.74020  ORF Transcript_26458/g.74020 Transcript_26458/m.74020 type:complete len:259 (-) Transcript_26458:853-1629(-)